MPHLAGRHVVIAGSARTVAALTQGIRAAGGAPVPAVVLETVPPADLSAVEAARASLAAGGFDAVAVTSAAAAPTIAGVAIPPTTWIAAVGRATAAAIEELGVAVSLVADDRSARGLLAAWPAGAARRVLLPQSDLSDTTLADGLRARGESPTVVVAYRTEFRSAQEEALRAIRSGAVVVVTSPSALAAVAPALEAATPIVAIGATTESAVIARGFSRVACAATPDAEGVAAAVAVLDGS